MRARPLLSFSFVAFAGLCPLQPVERGPAPRASCVEIPLAARVERAAVVDATELDAAPPLAPQRSLELAIDGWSDCPASIRRLIELARDRAFALAPAQLALLRDFAPFFELLPLERVVEVELDARRFELVFDAETIEIEVPARTRFVLQASEDERDPFRRGRPLARRSSANTLLVHRHLCFELGPPEVGGVAGIRPGDLEVEKGPFRIDVAVRTEVRAPGVARDELGRPWLACDARGEPMKRDGRWVAETFERWIVFEALGHRVEVGVPARAPSVEDHDSAHMARTIPPRVLSRCVR